MLEVSFSQLGVSFKSGSTLLSTVAMRLPTIALLGAPVAQWQESIPG